ncbi:MAG: class I SAM-dependent methyltransferase [Thermodesulfobacteriota bacterium]
MEEKGEAREGKLRQFILSHIREKGPIPFAQFMEWCLYHPQYGYYRSQRKKIGREGDFYTSPCVSPLFGGMIARQLLQMAEILGEKTFEVVEMGGGRGLLCEDILKWAKEQAPEFYQHLTYSLIETAPPFLREQRERLSEYQQEGKVSWIDPESFEDRTFQFRGCFLSNELIDSFPVHRVIYDKGRLKEIYITHQSGQLKELWTEPSDPRLSDYFKTLGITLQEGQKAEVNLKALDWIEKVSHSLLRGFVLTIDYGDTARELYSPHRMEGTLLCYFQHQSSENPYERLGEQDITAHVNFTALIQRGKEVALELTGLVPQYHFLIGLGLLQELESQQKRMEDLEALKLRLSLKHLIEPERGMGEVFKVLVQHKGVESPRLDGLRDFSSIPWPL